MTHLDAFGREIKPTDILLIKGYYSSFNDSIATIVRINRTTITVKIIEARTAYNASNGGEYTSNTFERTLRRYPYQCVVFTDQHINNLSVIPSEHKQFMTTLPDLPSHITHFQYDALLQEASNKDWRYCTSPYITNHTYPHRSNELKAYIAQTYPAFAI